MEVELAEKFSGFKTESASVSVPPASPDGLLMVTVRVLPWAIVAGAGLKVIAGLLTVTAMLLLKEPALKVRVPDPGASALMPRFVLVTPAGIVIVLAGTLNAFGFELATESVRAASASSRGLVIVTLSRSPATVVTED